MVVFQDDELQALSDIFRHNYVLNLIDRSADVASIKKGIDLYEKIHDKDQEFYKELLDLKKIYEGAENDGAISFTNEKIQALAQSFKHHKVDTTAINALSLKRIYEQIGEINTSPENEREWKRSKGAIELQTIRLLACGDNAKACAYGKAALEEAYSNYRKNTSDQY